VKHMPSLASVMTPFPQAIDYGDDLQAAASMMERKASVQLPVIRKGDLVGIVTARDLEAVRAVVPKSVNSWTVGDVAERDPYVVDIGARLDAVVKTMSTRRATTALVTREGKLVGILTAANACALLARVLVEAFPPPEDDQVA